MSAPRWARAVVAHFADPELVDEVIGDLDEAHRLRVARRGRALAAVLTSFEAVDIAFALRRHRGRLSRRRNRCVPSDMPAARKRRVLPFSWLDFKLGLRMMARYPGMTVVSCAAMAFGIAFGAGGLHLVTEMVFPDLPYSEKDRIVAIQKHNTRINASDQRALHDFPIWREAVTSVEQLGARHLTVRNLSVDGARAREVRTAAISTVLFNLAPVPPLLGRPLVPADEAPGAAPVVVLSHRIWRSAFDGDPSVVGRDVQLGGDAFTVVGVMPPEFRPFIPSNDLVYLYEEDLWIAFGLDPLAYDPGEGPVIDVFGQLAPGVTPGEALAELTTLGLSVEASQPEIHPYLIPVILSFAHPFGYGRLIGVNTALLVSIAFVALIMVLLCANVGLMMFARAAARETEIVVRSALGASRARVVGQLFVEALALASVSSFVGLIGATWGVRWVFGALSRTALADGQAMIPAIDLSLSATTAVSAGALALVGAVVAGVLPGLRVTAGASPGLPRAAGRVGSAPLGRVWSVILVSQIALTTTVVPLGAVMAVQAWRVRSTDLGFPGVEYVSASIQMDRESRESATDSGFLQRYEATYHELMRRVASEPEVTGVTVGDAMPASYHRSRRVEIETTAGPVPLERSVQAATVDASFFEVLGADIVAGRSFGALDLDSTARSVIVNESFVREALGGAYAVGTRIRYPQFAQDDEQAPWLEIVGVAEEIKMSTDPLLTSNAGVYHPLRSAEAYPVQMAVHVPGGAAQFAPRFQDLATDIAPELRVSDPVTLDRASDGHLYAYGGWAAFLAVAGALALLLTNAGIYAIVSFTVARRTREIGVRVALGADKGRIVSAILAGMAKRAMIGIVLGSLFATPVLLDGNAEEWLVGPVAWLLVGLYLVLMVGVCMAGCIVPTRRALSIQPNEALSAES
jgi:putative ABC transport system permease protein